MRQSDEEAGGSSGSKSSPRRDSRPEVTNAPHTTGAPAVPYTIVIPTLGRWQPASALSRETALRAEKRPFILVKTLAFLAKHRIPVANVILFVADADEEDRYRGAVASTAWADVRIQIGQRGILRQRNFIATFFEKDAYVVSIDDDVSNILWRNQPGVSVVTPLPDGCLEPLIFDAWAKMIKYKSYICGLNASQNPQSMSIDGISTRNGEVNGFLYFFRNRHDEDLMPKIADATEDAERSLRYFAKDRIVLRYRMYAGETRCFGNLAGLQTKFMEGEGQSATLKVLNERRCEEEKAAVKKLAEIFPGLVRSRDERKTKGTLHLKFLPTGGPVIPSTTVQALRDNIEADTGRRPFAAADKASPQRRQKTLHFKATAAAVQVKSPVPARERAPPQSDPRSSGAGQPYKPPGDVGQSEASETNEAKRILPTGACRSLPPPLTLLSAADGEDRTGTAEHRPAGLVAEAAPSSPGCSDESPKRLGALSDFLATLAPRPACWATGAEQWQGSAAASPQPLMAQASTDCAEKVATAGVAETLRAALQSSPSRRPGPKCVEEPFAAELAGAEASFQSAASAEPPPGSEATDEAPGQAMSSAAPPKGPEGAAASHPTAQEHPPISPTGCWRAGSLSPASPAGWNTMVLDDEDDAAEAAEGNQSSPSPADEEEAEDENSQLLAFVHQHQSISRGASMEDAILQAVIRECNGTYADPMGEGVRASEESFKLDREKRLQQRRKERELAAAHDAELRAALEASAREAGTEVEMPVPPTRAPARAAGDVDAAAVVIESQDMPSPPASPRQCAFFRRPSKRARTDDGVVEKLEALQQVFREMGFNIHPEKLRKVYNDSGRNLDRAVEMALCNGVC